MSAPPRWPVSLTVSDGMRPRLVLRPLGRRDREEWESLRRANAAYLQPWDPTPPDDEGGRRVGFATYVRGLNRDAREGTLLPFVMQVEGRLVGQIHLFGISRASLCSGAAGYWVARAQAGQGLTTRALAAVCDYALGPLGLHRVEVNIRPENAASLAVVRHLRMREEGVRERYMHIAGQWRDHRSFAITAEEAGGVPIIERWAERPLRG